MESQMTDRSKEERIAAADAHMREVDRGMDQVEASAWRYFQSVCPFHSKKVFVIAVGMKKFGAIFFYDRDEHVRIYAANGVSQKLEDFVYSELERVGRGTRDDISVIVEFDSHESVLAKHGGNYHQRLR